MLGIAVRHGNNKLWREPLEPFLMDSSLQPCEIKAISNVY